MRLISICCLFLLTWTSCLFTETKFVAPVQIIEINSHGEFFSPEKKLLKIGNSIKIVIKNSNLLYITPYIKIKTENIRDNNDNIIGDKVVKADTSYIVYALKKGDRRGLKFTLENFRNENGIIINADSLSLALGFSDKAFNYELGTPNTLVQNGNKKIEKYATKKTNIGEADSIYRYYDESLKKIDFSFSKRLDEQNKSKLYKTTFIYNKIPKGAFLPDMEVPRRELWYEMKIGKDKNLKRLEEILLKFEKERKKLNLNY